MRSPIRSVTVWLCAFVLAAQTPAPAPKAPATQPPSTPSAATPSPTQPIVRVTTHLVQVNVIVQDKKGQPVTDLTKDDFIILDKGQEQKVSTFSMESSVPAGGTPVAPVKRAPLPPNIFTNKMDRRVDAPKAVTIILFDGLNTTFADQAYARQQVIKYLQQVGPEDRVALYALGLNLTILHDFTSETARLLAALNKYKGRYAVELDAANPDPSDTGNDDLDAWLDHANQTMADFYQINKVNQTCEALEAIANHVSKVPGRKNLIWVSAGFPVYIGFDEAADRAAAAAASGSMDTSEKRTFNEEMERVARALNEANVAIYPVDARGLATSPTFQATTKQSYNARRPPTAQTAMPQSFYRTQDTMKILAESTGGKAYMDSNDLKNAIKHAIDDGRVSYVVGYYPTHNDWNGEFHDIKIQVRRPHLTVRYRLGYYAYADRSQDDKERMAVLRDAVWSPLEATSITLSARVDPSNEPKPGSVKLFLQVDPRDITLQLQEGRWMGALDLFFVQQNQEGQSPTPPLVDGIKLQLTPESRDKVFKSGVILGKAIEIVPTSTKLRVVVRDRPSGLVGSLNINLAKVLKKP